MASNGFPVTNKYTRVSVSVVPISISVSVQEGGLSIGTNQGSWYPFKKRKSKDNETLGSKCC
jgi:hypothetical protein